jgi:EmrB/QacA subfamily drug resistance transporter
MAARTQDASPTDDTLVHIDHRARMEILVAILIALFLAALDQTIVGVALPTVVTDLGGNELYIWVVTIYLLTSTITGPIYGKLSDQFGRKPLLMVGIGLFLTGSALSGLSNDMFQLILFRGVQGLGAGSLFPIALAVIGDLFSPKERGKYQGLFGAVFGISALIGPALGGWLTEYISWHWIFFVNLPIGAVALAIIWRLMPAGEGIGVSRRIDYLGVLVFTLALVPILVGVTNKQTLDWTDPWVGGLILLGLALAAVFVWVERRAAEPIVALDLFGNRTFTLSVVATFLASFGFFGAIIFLPRWYQVVNGSSPTEAGYQLLPLLGGLIISSIASGQLVSRTGRYKAITVVALLTLAGALLLMTSLHANTPPPVLWSWQFIAGLGIGPTFAVFTIIVQNAVPWQKLGVATSNLTFFRQIGGTVGLALAGTTFGSTLTAEAPARISAALLGQGMPQAQVDQLAGRVAQGGMRLDDLAGVGNLGQRILASVEAQARPALEPMLPSIVNAVHEAFSLAVANTMWIGVIATLVAAGAAFLLRELPLRTTVHAGSPVARGMPAQAPARD